MSGINTLNNVCIYCGNVQELRSLEIIMLKAENERLKTRCEKLERESRELKIEVSHLYTETHPPCARCNHPAEWHRDPYACTADAGCDCTKFETVLGVVMKHGDDMVKLAMAHEVAYEIAVGECDNLGQWVEDLFVVLEVHRKSSPQQAKEIVRRTTNLATATAILEVLRTRKEIAMNSEIELLRERTAQLEAAMELAADGDHIGVIVLEADGTPVIAINVNDTFGYACADCEVIPWSEVVRLNELRKAEGWPALVKWVAEHRGQKPLKEVQETIDKWDALKAENARLKKCLATVTAALAVVADRSRGVHHPRFDEWKNSEAGQHEFFDEWLVKQIFATLKEQG